MVKKKGKKYAGDEDHDSIVANLSMINNLLTEEMKTKEEKLKKANEELDKMKAKEKD